jgi:valacyclovir hydrolase
MPSVYVNGQKIFFEAFGDGQPVLLMHGWLQVGRDLLAIANNLADTYRVILPDMPGSGRSVPPYRTFPADFYHRDARLMVGFLDALNLSSVHIVGHSDGGEVALLTPILRPDLCRSVAVWGAVGAFDAELCDHVRREVLPMKINDSQRARHPGQNVDVWPAQWVEAFCAIVAAGGDVSLSRAHEIRCPLLLMLGDQDKLNPVAAGQRFIRAASNTADNGAPKQLEVFVGAGHQIHNQQPDKFLKTVRLFLQSHS